MTAIPALPHGCNSWIVTRRDTGAVDYLVRLNATLAAARGVA